MYRTVLGYGPVDGPLTDEKLAPSTRSSSDSYEPKAGVVQVPKRCEGVPREDASREHCVI